MDKVNLYKQECCSKCIHEKVCGAKDNFKDTEIITTHPFIKITLDCTEYRENEEEHQKLQAKNIG